jgi:hypothetical protein
MRSIQISTPVFAAIWAAHVEGEDSENEILARLLKVPFKAVEPETPQESGAPGFSDVRYGFHVPEGFEIFRRFKGTEHRARASNAKWVLEATGRSYENLADLSRAVGAAGENAWSGWHCRPNGGTPVTVGSLRSVETIQRRAR